MTVLDSIKILQLNKGTKIFTYLSQESYFEEQSIFELFSKKIIFFKD